MNEGKDPPATSVRTMEIAVAIFVFAFGALVVYDSMRLGAKWAEDGPQAGYFPFYIGLILCVASAVTFAGALRNRALAAKAFVGRGQLRLIMSVLVPLVIYVAVIRFVGIYIASIAFIGWFMRRLGGYSWLKTIAVSLVTMLAFFMMFEVWFKVPLPKGPLEVMLGLG